MSLIKSADVQDVYSLAHGLRAVYLTVAEVAERVRVSRATVTRWIRERGLPATRATRHGPWRIDEEAFDRWWAAQPCGGGQA